MANGHGGKRTPANPAPVSGPGAGSKRTDGQPVRSPGGMAYGENSDFRDIQSSAPMAQAASPNPNTRLGSAAATGATPPTPFGAPTERPDEPLTEGNPMGPGAGPGVLSVPMDGDSQRQTDMEAFKPYLPVLLAAANKGGANPTFVKFVRQIRGM